MANTKDQIDALITNWRKAITSRDINALVQLKSSTKTL
jgi:ketosteroid isomerase-like protein